MKEVASVGLDPLAAVPSHLRARIVSGMRWTLWLSLLASPLGYGTSILLARVGPEAIGTYGLLAVYLSLASGLIYLGGDAVLIKFIPELPQEKRLAFLGSYFLVTCLALGPWVVAAALWPQGLRHLFGGNIAAPYQVLLICLAPIHICFCLIVAALKGTLEIRWAQIMMRALTVVSFLIYATLFVLDRQLLSAHYTALIWGVYLGLVTLEGVFGMRHLVRMTAWKEGWRSLPFFLPRGFWSYTLATQQVSTLRFFIDRLDLLLILNFGGLILLGKYVAIRTLAEVIQVSNRFLTLDALMPSLTNVLAVRDTAAASQIMSVNLRLLFLANAATTFGLMFLAGPITALLGARYASVSKLFVVMVLFMGLSEAINVAGTLLTSLGKQQRSVWVRLGQLAIYGPLFYILWTRWQLLGAVIASGVAMLVSNVVLLVVARHSGDVHFSWARDYAALAGVGLLSFTAAMHWMPMPVPAALGAWAVSWGAFLLLGRYTLVECRALVSCFLPSSLRLGGNQPVYRFWGN
ncbi:MAG TPA: polysaccharide biosynthesis C-terminal domain-containing protein [Terriglobales bacterium]